MATHFEDYDRNGERETDPETAGHVDQLGIWSCVSSCEFGLERHAADRTIAWPDLPNLRVHRAGVDRAFRYISLRRLLRLSTDVLRRIFGELRFTALRAEVEASTVMVDF